MEDSLWNGLSKDSEYSNNKELYQNHILDQYKLYVEMADRISSRRHLTNVFFLSLNSILLGGVGFALEKLPFINSKYLILFPVTGMVLLCVVWWCLLKSYRNLNTAKYKVIGQLEKRLPASPYWSAEWKELGEGKDLKKYLPLTALENLIPIIFSLVYTIVAFYVVCIID